MTKAADQPADSPDVPKYRLRLFVTGATPHSMLAVENINNISQQYLAGRYELEIVDVYQQPELAEQEQIIAAPTLIKISPLPIRRLIGDLSDRPKVLAALGIATSVRAVSESTDSSGATEKPYNV